MPYNRKAFGVVISRLRVQKGLTQERLSGLAGIARSHLVALENGEKTVKLDTMWRIADALEIRPSDLVRRTEAESAEEEANR
jgi:transcriptional regulator with XRE-family HTH domain